MRGSSLGSSRSWENCTELPDEYPNEISSDKRTILSKECCFGSKRFHGMLYFLLRERMYDWVEESKTKRASTKTAGKSCERNRTNQWLTLFEFNPISRKFSVFTWILIIFCIQLFSFVFCFQKGYYIDLQSLYKHIFVQITYYMSTYYMQFIVILTEFNII